jgi:hypothetical protein
MRDIKREIMDFQMRDCGVQIFKILFILKSHDHQKVGDGPNESGLSKLINR